MKKKALLIGIYDTNTVSLAPQILRSYAENNSSVAEQFEIITKEFSIFSDSIEHMVSTINSEGADIVGFSVYIWNFSEVLEVIKHMRRSVVILGGPQVTGIEKDFLHDNPAIDIIVTGEGEDVFVSLLEYFVAKKELENIPGITTRDIQTSRGSAVEMGKCPSIYERIFRDNPGLSWISLETSRGCPMGCGFCTWSSERTMRYLSVDRAKHDLDIILAQPSIKVIYLCDSSLLLNKKRAKVILNHIIDADTDKVIRYEFSAEQLDEELVDLLVELPGHEFNLGMQSTNKNALRDMGRVFRRKIFERNYQYISNKFKGANNITVDLIYGLPGDNIEGFKASLNYVLSLPEVRRILTNPLIVLPGSAFYRDRKKYKLELRDDKSYIAESNYTFSSIEMEFARKYSFFVAVIYFNYCLRDNVKMVAEKLGKSYIDTIIDFMDSLPFDIFEGENYPDMIPSVRRGFDLRNMAFITVIEKYDDIINHFRSSFRNVLDVDLSSHRECFSDHFYKIKQLLLGV